MSFSIQLTPDLAQVEPGSTTPVSVVIANRGSAQDRFEMEIEGVDPEWKAVPVPVFTVDAGEEHTEKVFFKPRRTSESLSGNYPFVVRVRSLESGEQRTIQGVLHVKPYHHLTMEISPKKGFVRPARKQNTFYVTIVNLGNTEHTVQLVGSDPEDSCTYDFEHEQVTVAPGQQREVEIYANPSNPRLFSGSKLIGFTITGRSQDVPTVVTSAQAQLEHRSLLSPTTLITALVALVLLGAWWLMMPKPPSLTLSIDRFQVTQGEEVTVTWSAERARQVTIRLGEEVLYDGPSLSGSRPVMLTQSGTVTFRGTAIRDGKEVVQSIQLTVDPAEFVPAPQIVLLQASPERVRLGESFVLRYRFNDSVERAILTPRNIDLDLRVNEIEVTPARDGTQPYTVVATNRAGQSVQRTVQVQVVDESDARIPVLRATPESIQGPDDRVRIEWFITGAVRAELAYGTQTMTISNEGSMDFAVTERTVFAITAYDNRARPVTRRITVEYLPPPPPPVNPPDTGGTDGTTAGGGATASTAGGTGFGTGATGGRP
jgi:hypothetical protein